MFSWRVLRAASGTIELVDTWPTLAEVIWEMACGSWEEPGNAWLSYVVEEATGVVAATAIFGANQELLICVSDGRRFTFPLPESYRKPAAS